MAMTVWRTGAWSLQIVKRSDVAGFEVLHKRWIVERTFAWISRNRRLAREFERYATTVAAFIRLAMIRIMLRRLAANASPQSKLPGWALNQSIFDEPFLPARPPKVQFCRLLVRYRTDFK